jgi:hypothetical protein
VKESDYTYAAELANLIVTRDKPSANLINHVLPYHDTSFVQRDIILSSSVKDGIEMKQHENHEDLTL